MVRRSSTRRSARLTPARARALRARRVRLRPGGEMPWHSTEHREELIVVLAGRPEVVYRMASGRLRRLRLAAGQCVFLPAVTQHTVVNRTRRAATYLYVTAPTP